jgi:hypothetical protein
MGKTTELLILIVVVVLLCYFISYKASESSGSWCDRFNISPYFGAAKYQSMVKCGDDLGAYYKAKYTDKVRYNPLSTDAMDYLALKKHHENKVLQDMWKKQQAAQAGATQTAPSNSQLKESFAYNKHDRGSDALLHEYMADNKKTEDRNAPLSVNDLLPDPCMNKGKDWTNVFTECENLVGGQNFVRFEDEHFTNQVLDTRCTKYQSHDLRRTPAIQYADVSIWNKPSVCKNIFEYIRPTLDGNC